MEDSNNPMKEILDDLQRTSVWIAAFALFLVVLYLIVVLLSRYVYMPYKGYIPDFSRNLLRVLFYALSAASVIGFEVVRKKRYTSGRLRELLQEPRDFVGHVIMSVAFLMTLAVMPLLCGFLLFFLGAMYTDFYILSALTVALILRSVVRARFIEDRLRG